MNQTAGDSSNLRGENSSAAGLVCYIALDMFLFNEKRSGFASNLRRVSSSSSYMKDEPTTFGKLDPQIEF